MHYAGLFIHIANTRLYIPALTSSPGDANLLYRCHCLLRKAISDVPDV